MTSSLVGSEMCIRDSRKYEASTNEGFAGKVHLCIATAASLACTLKRRKVCLLYTSDAADDM
eukprot:1621877-Prorocentrum_lima.AAC.1